MRKHLVFGAPVLTGMSIKVTEEVRGNNSVPAESAHGETSPPPQSSSQLDRL